MHLTKSNLITTMKTFDEYVLSWWKEFLNSIDNATAQHIMENEFLEKEEDISDYLAYDDCEVHTCKEWLELQDDALTIYKKFFGYGVNKTYHNLPTTESFLVDLFIQAARWYDWSDDEQPSFAREFCFEMAGKAAGYTEPMTYFSDLQHGGCQSGMVGMLIYNSDCKKIYIEHIEDMEQYIEQIEEETGAPLKNEKRLPHYTFVCWVCFEELGHTIAQQLYPDEF